MSQPTKQLLSNPSSDTAHLFLTEVKKRTLQEKGKMDYRQLRKSGYSESTITHLKQIRMTA